MAGESLRVCGNVARARVRGGQRAGRPGNPYAASTLRRVVTYTAARAAVLALMVAVGVFLAILFINLGGFIDKIYRDRIEWAIDGLSMSMRDVPMEEKLPLLEPVRWQMEEAAGLHDPFLLRCVQFLWRGLTLDWGEASLYSSQSDKPMQVWQVILGRLPNTLLLAGAANLLLFVATLFLALALSRNQGSWLDRIIIGLSPISAAPNWVYGILLTIVFAAQLRLLPFNGMLDSMPPATRLGYVPIVLKHMILPVAAIFLSLFFQGVYAWRTFFLLHSREDYVEMAEAKGLPARMVERRYILRPSLPYILTSFAMLVITFWQGALALEIFFDWPGIGALFVTSVWHYDRMMVLGLIVAFAYLLALSVFVLDVLYAVVDPRVRIGSAGQTVRTRQRRVRRAPALWRPSRLWPRRRGPGQPAFSAASGRARVPWSSRVRGLGAGMRRLSASVREMARYPSAVAGLAIIAVLLGVSIYAPFALPREEAIVHWRGDRDLVYRNPRLAQPVWVNLFRKDDLPGTLVLDSRDAGVPPEPGPDRAVVRKSARSVSAEMTEVTISFAFDYPYTALPQDLAVFFTSQYEQKKPYVSLALFTPGGRKIDLKGFTITSAGTYLASTDPRLRRQNAFGGEGGHPLQALFGGPEAEAPVALPGTYELRVTGNAFDGSRDLDAQFVLYGQVHGLAGTDHKRRDLGVALLWGAPVALGFGLLGAVATSLASLVLAAAGVWFGGRVDDLVQRITEVNMILPALPLAMTVYLVYAKSIWAILGVMVVLSIFGSATKSYRAMFLQVKESPYVEAARVYGARGWRVITRYLVPRSLPVLIPQLVILIPGYVFLEATLAYLGVSDLHLPTWGKVINDALTNNVFQGHFYWVLQPVGLLMLTGLAFAMLGFALDTIFNPRLRER